MVVRPRRRSRWASSAASLRALDREARDRRAARRRVRRCASPPGRNGRSAQAAPRRVGEAETGLDAEAGDPRRDLVHERRLAAEEVGAARDVEQQPVLAVHRAPGREAVAPEGEPLEPLPVRRRVGARRDEAGVQSAGVGKAHAGPQPLCAGLAVDRPQHRPAAARCHQGEGDRRGRARAFPFHTETLWLFVAHGGRPAAGACREGAAEAAGRGRGLSRVRQGRTRSSRLSRRPARGTGAEPRPRPLAA